MPLAHLYPGSMLHHSTTTKYDDGPWLIDRSQMNKLGNVVTECWSRLEKRRQSLIADRIKETIERIETSVRSDSPLQEYLDESKSEEELLAQKKEKKEKEQRAMEQRVEAITSEVQNHWEFEEKRSLELLLKSGKIAKFESWEQALNDINMKSETPMGFKLSLSSAGVAIALTFDSSRNELRVTPEQDRAASSEFLSIERWVESVQRSRAERFVYKWRFLLAPVMVTFAFFFFAALMRGEATHRETGRQLLENGLSEQELLPAIEVLLALESRHEAPGHQLPSWFWWYLGACGFAVLACVMPRARFGLGRGEQSVSRWRLWLKAVFLLAPTYVCTTFLVPAIQALL